MSSIDLVILGMVLEKPQSAYDIQKDVEYHCFPMWPKISVSSIYRKVIAELDVLFQRIYKGNVSGKLSDEDFQLCRQAMNPSKKH